MISFCERNHFGPKLPHNVVVEEKCDCLFRVLVECVFEDLEAFFSKDVAEEALLSYFSLHGTEGGVQEKSAHSYLVLSVYFTRENFVKEVVDFFIPFILRPMVSTKRNGELFEVLSESFSASSKKTFIALI